MKNTIIVPSKTSLEEIAFVGRNIRRFRDEKGLIAEMLSECAEVPVRTLTRVENGANTSLFTLYKISKGLRVPLSEICTEKFILPGEDIPLEYRLLYRMATQEEKRTFLRLMDLYFHSEHNIHI